MIYFYLGGIRGPRSLSRGALRPASCALTVLRPCSAPCALFWKVSCALRLDVIGPRSAVQGAAARWTNKKGAEAPFVSVPLSRLILLGSSPCIICKRCIERGALLLLMQGKGPRSPCLDRLDPRLLGMSGALASNARPLARGRRRIASRCRGGIRIGGCKRSKYPLHLEARPKRGTGPPRDRRMSRRE